MDAFLHARLTRLRDSMLDALNDNTQRAATGAPERTYAAAAHSLCEKMWREFLSEAPRMSSVAAPAAAAEAAGQQQVEEELRLLTNINVTLRKQVKAQNQIAQRALRVIVGPVGADSAQTLGGIHAQLEAEVTRMRDELFALHHAAKDTDFEEGDLSLDDFLRLAEFKLSHAASHVFRAAPAASDASSGGGGGGMSQLDVELRLQQVARESQAQVARLERMLDAEKMATANVARTARQDLEEQQRQHDEAIAKLRRVHQQELLQVSEGLREDIKSLTEDHEMKMHELQKQFVEQLSSQKEIDAESRRTAIVKMRNTINAEKERVTALLDSRGGKLRPPEDATVEEENVHAAWEGETRETLVRLLQGKRAEIEMMKSSFTIQTKARTLEWESMLRDITRRYEAELATQREEVSVESLRLEKVQKQLEARTQELSQAQRALVKQNDEWDARLLETRAQLEAELRERAARLEQVQAELTVTTKTLIELNSDAVQRTAAHEAAVADLTQAVGHWRQQAERRPLTADAEAQTEDSGPLPPFSLSALPHAAASEALTAAATLVVAVGDMGASAETRRATLPPTPSPRRVKRGGRKKKEQRPAAAVAAAAAAPSGGTNAGVVVRDLHGGVPPTAAAGDSKAPGDSARENQGGARLADVAASRSGSASSRCSASSASASSAKATCDEAAECTVDRGGQELVADSRVRRATNASTNLAAVLAVKKDDNGSSSSSSSSFTTTTTTGGAACAGDGVAYAVRQTSLELLSAAGPNQNNDLATAAAAPERAPMSAGVVGLGAQPQQRPVVNERAGYQPAAEVCGDARAEFTSPGRDDSGHRTDASDLRTVTDGVFITASSAGLFSEQPPGDGVHGHGRPAPNNQHHDNRPSPASSRMSGALEGAATRAAAFDAAELSDLLPRLTAAEHFFAQLSRMAVLSDYALATPMQHTQSPQIKRLHRLLPARFARQLASTPVTPVHPLDVVTVAHFVGERLVRPPAHALEQPTAAELRLRRELQRCAVALDRTAINCGLAARWAAVPTAEASRYAAGDRGSVRAVAPSDVRIIVDVVVDALEAHSQLLALSSASAATLRATTRSGGATTRTWSPVLVVANFKLGDATRPAQAATRAVQHLVDAESALCEAAEAHAASQRAHHRRRHRLAKHKQGQSSAPLPLLAGPHVRSPLAPPSSPRPPDAPRSPAPPPPALCVGGAAAVGNAASVGGKVAASPRTKR